MIVYITVKFSLL